MVFTTEFDPYEETLLTEMQEKYHFALPRDVNDGSYEHFACSALTKLPITPTTTSSQLVGTAVKKTFEGFGVFAGTVPLSW